MRKSRNSERGVTVVMVAMFITGLLMVSALAIDLGVLYTARTSAQHGADAAALAGAYTFINPCNYPTGGAPLAGCLTSNTYTNAATQAAITVAAQNQILGKQVAITAGNVQVDEANRRVTVTVPRLAASGNGVRTYFAAVMKWQSVDVVTRATAQAGTKGSASRCLKPVFVPNTVLSPNDAVTACSKGEVIFDNSGQLTTFGKARIGQTVFLRPLTPSCALLPGQYEDLDFGAGNATYDCVWSGGCLNTCNASISVLQCNGQSIQVQPGNKSYPLTKAINTLIGNPPDTWGSIGTYYLGGNTSQPSSDSRSLSTFPVWNNCLPGQQITTGIFSVKTVGFIEMFVDGTSSVPQCPPKTTPKQTSAKTHLVNEITCDVGSGGSGGSGANSGPNGIPIRLVQNP